MLFSSNAENYGSIGSDEMIQILKGDATKSIYKKDVKNYAFQIISGDFSFLENDFQKSAKIGLILMNLKETFMILLKTRLDISDKFGPEILKFLSDKVKRFVFFKNDGEGYDYDGKIFDYSQKNEVLNLLLKDFNILFKKIFENYPDIKDIIFKAYSENTNNGDIKTLTGEKLASNF